MFQAAAFSQYANPAPVTLATVGTYGAIAFSGITGTSVVNGDVGTISSSVAAGITVVNGTNWGTAGSHNIDAQTDLSNALLDASGRANDLIIPADALGGLILGRGVYVGIALDLGADDTLTLNGSATDVFIIKSNSSLTINANSVILLTGGALWNNVFWYVGSSAQIFGGTSFTGIVLAAASISLAANAMVTTQLLANGGAVTINSDILPVELGSFTASINKSNVELNWNTVTEVNNYGFEIQKRSDKSSWFKTGFVEGYGNSNSMKEYSFIDNNPQSGKMQYRIKQIDFDGTFEYSNIVEIELELPMQFSVEQNYPNPFNPSTYILYQIPVKSLVAIKVYNALGIEVAILLNEEKLPGNYRVKFNASDMSSGIYFCTVSMNGNNPITKKMILLK